ncbi:hypothetical protein RvY_05718 [Ramazzottius varieornatus]|uniref:Cytochrome b5 heme-binding domain-containing protein n=1 Tax=Ramazzottius varieornatus TaxID=947166 RepID=A0A1D1UW16_RAMVA|nr:hypothetical protein RvY_05718 [Ramazzottius varieornatus]
MDDSSMPPPPTIDALSPSSSPEKVTLEVPSTTSMENSQASQLLNVTETSPEVVAKGKKVSRKVQLKPGYALTNWVDRTKSGEDMTGLGGPSEARIITKEELARHNTEADAWMAIRGKVYNISKYLDYHPGGLPILMAEAGTDATLLFDKNHRWVNVDRLLASCQVGRLKQMTLTI